VYRESTWGDLMSIRGEAGRAGNSIHNVQSSGI